MISREAENLYKEVAIPKSQIKRYRSKSLHESKSVSKWEGCHATYN